MSGLRTSRSHNFNSTCLSCVHTHTLAGAACSLLEGLWLGLEGHSRCVLLACSEQGL